MPSAIAACATRFRYLLGALDGFDAKERVDAGADAGARALGAASPGGARRAWSAARVDDFDFAQLFTALHNFCAVDLSAFYFDIRKDALYCDRPDDAAPARRAHGARPALQLPRPPGWRRSSASPPRRPGSSARPHGERGLDRQRASAHLSRRCRRPGATRRWRRKWNKIRDLRRVVTGALELERADKRIGSSLQAHPTVYRHRRLCRGARRARSGGDLHHLGGHLAAGRAARRRLHAARRARGRRGRRAGRAATNASAAGACCRRWAAMPAIPASAAAAPTRSGREAAGRKKRSYEGSERRHRRSATATVSPLPLRGSGRVRGRASRAGRARAVAPRPAGTELCRAVARSGSGVRSAARGQRDAIPAAAPSPLPLRKGRGNVLRVR